MKSMKWQMRRIQVIGKFTPDPSLRLSYVTCGANGANGASGANGDNGASGANGDNGANGANGASGAK